MNIKGIVSALPNMPPGDRDTVRKRAKSWLEAGSDEQKTAAQKVLVALEEVESQEVQQLAAHVDSLPLVNRLIEAFTQPPMTEKEQKVVQVLLDNPGLTSAKLTRKLGWRAQAWHLHFGTMCSDRRGRLWPGPRSEKREAEFYTGIIADFDQHTHSFAMKPEAMKAFAALGLHGR